ncbi:glycosyltransferase [Allokutzneria oryzae]|uniref:Glycosyltransferase n=1 Tax=Allokutzneria oryzae TaxID=1378989 RepID=A0ABV5ZS72_9PSEU
MRIVIMAVGGRGDVAPYTGLGLRLREAGHDVAIAAESAHEPLVRSAGLEFRVLPGNSQADLDTEDGKRWQESGTGVRALVSATRLFTQLMKDLCDGVRGAAEGADLLLLHHLTIYQGYAVGKAMGIPTMALELFPTGMAPTGDFPPAELSLPDLGRWANRNVDRLVGALTSPAVRFFADFQRELGLPGIGLSSMVRALHEEDWPILHGFSPEVVPRPRDWRPGIEVSGYWWPAVPQGWRPPAELVDFLDAGPPPVFVGFGSMAQGEGERLSEITAAALRRAGVRGIVQAGWAGMAVAGDDVFSVGDVPHEWLFPRTAAVVHHGGAGTTGAALRAGVPAIAAPLMADQPFWADRLVRLGVSPGSAGLRALDARRLGELITQAVTDPRFGDRARTLAERIRAEDGAGQVVKAVERLAR